jgi:hypothetical protein
MACNANRVVTFWPIFINGTLYSDYTLVQVVGMPDRDVSTCIKIGYGNKNPRTYMWRIVVIAVIAPQIDSPILAKQVGIKPYS